MVEPLNPGVITKSVTVTMLLERRAAFVVGKAAKTWAVHADADGCDSPECQRQAEAQSIALDCAKSGKCLMCTWLCAMAELVVVYKYVDRT